MKQTAVEWLIDELLRGEYIPKYSIFMNCVIKQAKEMEKEQQDKNKYSEEEVRQMLWDLGDVLFNNNQNGIKEGEPKKYIEEIIEQFKNK